MLDNLGALDPAAVERVREEAWPEPESAEEVHDALSWLGFVTDEEAAGWLPWLLDLVGQNRVVHERGRWRAVDGPTDLKAILLGRLEGLGPVFEGDPRISFDGQEQSLLLELENDGAILRTRLDGKTAWCERRLLARIHRATIDKLRREIEPVSAADFLHFLDCWQHVDEKYRLEGPRGVAEVLRQLAGFEAPARLWERRIIARRVRDYQREWLDEVTLSGEFAWGRLWGSAGSAISVTPITFVPREQLDDWLALSSEPTTKNMGGPAADLLGAMQAGGPMFPQNLPKAANLVPAHVEMGLTDLLARGFITCDSFAALRQMITPPSRRRRALVPVGRWCCFRAAPFLPLPLGEGRGEGDLRALSPVSDRATRPNDEQTELVARQLLRRTGVVFHRTLKREKIPVTWSALRRAYRRMELRGEIRGGRFVSRFSGEQFALPQAVELLRRLRREGPREPIATFASDPLNYAGILTPTEEAPRLAPLPVYGDESHGRETRRRGVG